MFIHLKDKPKIHLPYCKILSAQRRADLLRGDQNQHVDEGLIDDRKRIIDHGLSFIYISAARKIFNGSCFLFRILVRDYDQFPGQSVC